MTIIEYSMLRSLKDLDLVSYGAPPLPSGFFFTNISLMSSVASMTTKGCKQKDNEILVVSARDLLSVNHTLCQEPDIADHKIVEELENAGSLPAILNLRFPFEYKAGPSKGSRGLAYQSIQRVNHLRQWHWQDGDCI